MQFLVDYQWEIFITIEIISLISLLLFGIFRYGLNQRKLSMMAIILFLTLLITEALLGVLIYQETKTFSSFQIIVLIFVLYACTFGIFDFIKLDRWMRKKVGKWRNIELLTAKDYIVLNRQKNPAYVARKYRISSMIHTALFLIGQSALWMHGTENLAELVSFLTDLSWIETGDFIHSPYANEVTYGIGMVWGLVFFIDLIYSWSYTLLPSKGNKGT